MIANLKTVLKAFFFFFTSTILFLFYLFFYSCNNRNNNEKRKPISLSFERFDLKFYNQPPSVIPKLKKDYSFISKTIFG
ncbi:MAG: hypothetical protein CM15mP122_2680 [Bacteroidota bacterium]|nr:MAG: hypothetical protein CM15mP122_2680 [Bacteroidota bacterium]